MNGDKGHARRSARTASEAIAEQIRSRIASGDLQPDDMLPSERVLLETYDVARPTMRGALRILESDGLISVERGVHGGARIVEPDLSSLARRVGLHLQLRGTDLRELLEAQVAIQPGAAALAARARDDADLALLRAAVQRCVDAGGIEEFVLSVAHFGTAVLRASHNRVLELYGELTVAILIEVLDAYVTQAGITLETADEAIRWAERQFATLVDLIEEGDGDRAEQFWRKQLARLGAGRRQTPSPFEMYTVNR